MTQGSLRRASQYEATLILGIMTFVTNRLNTAVTSLNPRGLGD